MTQALFITTSTSENRDEGVACWGRYMGPVEHVTFDIDGPPHNADILLAAHFHKPDVIFYTGGESGAGLPTYETLRALRKIAPMILIAGDLSDPPWWPTLDLYRENECFDLYVAQDGVHSAPVDHVTVTPIDVAQFDRQRLTRNITCGFAGNLVPKPRHEHVKKLHNTEDPRSALLHGLSMVRLRERETDGSYGSYVAFLKRCRMIINTSLTGSGKVHHLKGRVIEAAFAGCALLEMRGSPIGEWFPRDLYFTYGSASEAAEIIENTSFGDMERLGAAFGAYAREHYHPKKVLDGIMHALKVRQNR